MTMRGQGKITTHVTFAPLYSPTVYKIILVVPSVLPTV